jgi:hypothetical protein
MLFLKSSGSGIGSPGIFFTPREKPAPVKSIGRAFSKLPLKHGQTGVGTMAGCQNRTKRKANRRWQSNKQ